ncbi:MAG: GDP-mannose 4,6-dehydratase [Nanoarchaeota archaeon]
MNILVTGCGGFVGSYVSEALLKRGDVVIGIDNINEYYDQTIKEKNILTLKKFNNFKFYKSDITNFQEIKKVFLENKIEKIVHLAARAGVRPSIENPELYFNVNVNGTENLLKLAVGSKVKNFIFGSSSSVYGTNKKAPFSEEDPIDNIISPYAQTKREGERLCKKYHEEVGINITCLRFFTVYGPRGRPDMAIYKFTKLITEGKEIPMYGDGNSKRDYTYITDIVFGIISALDKNLKFEIVNLGNSSPISLSGMIRLIEKKLNKKAKINSMPKQKGDVELTYADISKAKRLLEYEPKVKIEEGIKRFVEWYRQR